MASEQCIPSLKTLILPVTAIGIVLSIAILCIVSCLKRICCRTIKWPHGHSPSIVEKWQKIEELSKKEDTRPLSIIYACSLVDHILKSKGYPGECLSERLDSAQTAIGYSQIRNILRLRNELAHDAAMKSLEKKKIQSDLKIIRQILSDLNVSV